MVHRYVYPKLLWGTKRALQIQRESEDGYTWGLTGNIEDSIKGYLSEFPELKINEVDWYIWSEVDKEFILIQAKSIKEWVSKFNDLESCLEWEATK